MNRENCYQLGFVIKPHGIVGDVYIYLDVDAPQEYKKLESVFIEINNKLVPFFISAIAVRGLKALVHFEGCDSLNQAEMLKSKKIYLPLETLPELEGDQFYYHEILGYTVVDKNDGPLGKVVNVYSRSGQDLLAMNYKNKEVLIPITGEIIGKADTERLELSVDLPNGLLELYLED